MAARFCAECGAAFVDDARFCVQCGQRRAGARGPVGFSLTRFPALFVVGAVVTVGAIAITIGNFNQNPPPKVPARDAGPAQPTAAMPADHPPVELPPDVKKAIEELQKTADGKPQDAEAWRHVGNVLTRAAQIDRSYLAQADKAFRRLLEIVPEDLEALRSLGNIAFDLEQHDVAVDFYQRYLKQKPDDLGVQTDLGTMYLSKGDFARAVRTYDQVLKVDPKYFQAQFNLAIAYRSAGQNDAALAALQSAKEMAPDEESKNQVDRLIARAQGMPAAPPAAAGAAAPAGSGAAPAGTFRESVEAIFKQHQILASKVQRFEWQSDSSAKLYLNEFPMSQMPEGMRSLFLERMKERLKQAKAKFNVSEPLAIELVDLASGEVMATIRE